MTTPNLSTYGGFTQDAGIQGALADLTAHDVLTYVNSGATAIELGNAVAAAATDGSCKAPAADGDKLVGLAIRHHAKANNASGTVNYAQYEEVPVIKKGDLWVLCTEAYAVGDAVLSKTAGGGSIGSTTGGAAGAGRVAVPGATFLTSGLANSIAKVRINS